MRLIVRCCIYGSSNSSGQADCSSSQAVYLLSVLFHSAHSHSLLRALSRTIALSASSNLCVERWCERGMLITRTLEMILRWFYAFNRPQIPWNHSLDLAVSTASNLCTLPAWAGSGIASVSSGNVQRILFLYWLIEPNSLRQMSKD